MLFVGTSFSSAGDLDPTFGTNGIVTTALGMSEAKALASQANGMLVAAGHAFGPGPNNQTDFALARYKPNGELDEGFDQDGMVKTDFAATLDTQGDDAAEAVGVQSDQKIVVAGISCGHQAFTANDAAGCAIALARYRPDGNLDTSFGVNGKVLTDSQFIEKIDALAIQPDGKIILSGSINEAFSLIRFLPSGIIDSSFGAGGIATVKFGTEFGSVEGVGAIALQADGKIVAAGQANSVGKSYPGSGDFGIARFSADGHLDLSFGTNGLVATDFEGRRESALALLIQADGKLVAGGGSCVRGAACNFDFALARYTEQGQLDVSFGPQLDGKVISDLGTHDYVRGLVEADKKIVAVGYTCGSLATCHSEDKFALAGYESDGTLSRGFGTEGILFTPIGTASRANAVLPHINGSFVAAGRSDGKFALARYLPSQADLSISISDTPDPVKVAQALTYTLTVTNSGPDPADQVSLNDPIPEGLGTEDISVSASTGSCSYASRTVRCELGTLDKDASATVTIKTTAPSLPILGLSNTASVASFTFDPNPGPNSNSATALTDVIDSSSPSPDPTLEPPKAPAVDPGPVPPASVIQSPGGVSSGVPSAAPPSGPGGTPGALASTVPSSVSAPVSSAASAPIGGPAIQPQITPGGVSSSVPGQVPALSAGSALSDLSQDERKGAAVFNMVGHSDSKAPLFSFMLTAFMLLVAVAYSVRLGHGEARHPAENPAFAIARI